MRDRYDRFMTWHRKHRGRVCACYFFVAAWTVVAVNSLDGVLVTGVSEFSWLRAMSAGYVLVGGLVIFANLFYRMPFWVSMTAWAFFGSGLMFWATVATNGWPLFALSGCAGWWQAWHISRGRTDCKAE